MFRHRSQRGVYEFVYRLFIVSALPELLCSAQSRVSFASKYTFPSLVANINLLISFKGSIYAEPYVRRLPAEVEAFFSFLFCRNKKKFSLIFSRTACSG